MKAYRVYRVVAIDGDKVLVKRARRIRKAAGLKMTRVCEGRNLEGFLLGNEKSGYGLILTYVYLMTDGKSQYIVYGDKDFLEGVVRADRIMWEDGSISKISIK